MGRSIKTALPHRTYIVHDGVGGRSGGQFSMVQTILTHEELPEVLGVVEEVDDCFYFHIDVGKVSRRDDITPIGAAKKGPS